MQFDSVEAFFAMGKYGFYVWFSFGISFVVLLALAIEPIFKRRGLLKSLAKKEARDQRMKAAETLEGRL